MLGDVELTEEVHPLVGGFVYKIVEEAYERADK